MTTRDPAAWLRSPHLAALSRAPGRARSRGRVATFIRWAPYVVPAVVLSTVFVLYPALDAIRLSFVDWAGYGEKLWIGFDNYSSLIHDDTFLGSVLHSLVIATIVTVVTVGVGTVMAALFDRRLPGRGIFQFLIFLPVILPNTFIAIAWAAGLDPYTGWVPTVLHRFDPHASANWLNSSSGIYVVAAVAILQTAGLPMVIILGAFSKISPEIHEAATLDGVNGFKRAWRISVPLVRDVIAAIALLQFVWQFSAFEYIYIMTNGGPGTATEVTSTFIYHEAFGTREFGYAAAAAVATSLIVAFVVMVYFTILRPKGIERAG